jgi:hypothetical protein
VKPGLANKLGACDLNTSVGAPVLRDCRAHSRRQVPAESPKCSYGELIPVAIYGICLSLGYERLRGASHRSGADQIDAYCE